MHYRLPSQRRIYLALALACAAAMAFALYAQHWLGLEPCPLCIFQRVAVLAVGAAALGFLILIHKLEYFLNARIVGTQIRSRAWELLVAMLAMEAAFGLAGLIAAPIYYAYLKGELESARLI